VKGDTLWDISSRYLQSPWLWPEIWHANPQIENPHLIYPGDVIGLIYVKGQPKVTTLKRGEASRTIKLTPKARITPIETAIPAIPLDAISSFLTSSRIVEKADLDAAPYVLEGKEGHIVSGAGDVVYARGDVQSATTFGVFRASKSYMDPVTKEFLGLEAREIGLAKVKAVDGEVVTLTVQRTREELLKGDRLLATEDRVITTTYHPSAPLDGIQGQMISVLNGVNNIGQYDVVVVNRGAREGVKDGNVFAVYRKGGFVRDPVTDETIELPSERAGILMVFRTFEKLSYALILKAYRPLSVNDEIRKP
jgi:nucleoid-associated protein YgaU